MKIAIVLLIVLPLALCSCNNASYCFVKTLFDFSYPEQNVYNITMNGPSQPQNYIIMGYGDFNNDLRTDYAALDPVTNNLLVYYYSNSPRDGEYVLTNNSVILANTTNGCTPLNLYLYDADNNYALDITVWGEYANSSKCLILLLQQNGQFSASGANMTFNASNTQPFLFESLISGTRLTYFLIYDETNKCRTILVYNLGVYTQSPWNKFFDNEDYSAIAFSQPHWNSFIDLTNDCFSDIVINSQQQEIEFWVYNATAYLFSLASKQPTPNITSMTFLDINYDGIQDLITAVPTQLSMFLGTVPTPDGFCIQNKTSFNFDWANPTVLSMPGCSLNPQNIHFGDLNIDGYPDLMLTCTVNNLSQILVYENMMESGSFSPFQKYQTKINQSITSLNLSATRASFFDVLENGIIDFIFTIDNATLVLYNNYLYQNFYYIKGYATNGESNNFGNQVPGATFYYLNSLGNQQRVAVYSQMTQTAYFAMPMPYIVTGLGRANNYVEQFTLGRLGDHRSWSPIIPNSQLAVFSGEKSESGWNIKIFIMPTDSIVYVLIVCIVVLAVLGTILIVLKCMKKKSVQDPIMMDYM